MKSTILKVRLLLPDLSCMHYAAKRIEVIHSDLSLTEGDL
jgi:hypothetical protein